MRQEHDILHVPPKQYLFKPHNFLLSTLFVLCCMYRLLPIDSPAARAFQSKVSQYREACDDAMSCSSGSGGSSSSSGAELEGTAWMSKSAAAWTPGLLLVGGEDGFGGVPLIEVGSAARVIMALLWITRPLFSYPAASAWACDCLGCVSAAFRAVHLYSALLFATLPMNKVEQINCNTASLTAAVCF